MKIIDPNDYLNFQPVGDKVLLALAKVDPNDLQDVGGGILAAKDFADKKTPYRETVVTAVGPDVKQIKKGDTVLWNLHTATHWWPFGLHDLHFLAEANVICITKKAAKPLVEQCQEVITEHIGKKDGNGFPYPVDGKPGGAPDEGTS